MTQEKTTEAMTDTEITEALAVEVMEAFRNARNGSLTMGNVPAPPQGVDDNAPRWNPLTDWNDTMQVVAECERRKFCVLIEYQKNLGPWAVSILPNHIMVGLLAKNDGKVPFEAYIQEEPVQRAICLAALRAVRSLT